MYVKRLQQEELQQALTLVWEVFSEDVAPLYTEEGIATFQQFIDYNAMLPKILNGSLNFFGAYEGDALCGVSAVRFDGHVSLLFVAQEWRKRGAAKMMMQAMHYYCSELRRLPRMTVNAAPNAQEVYEKFGFVALAPEQNDHGIRFIPMERKLVVAMQKNNLKQPEKKDAMIRTIIMVVCMYILFNTFFTFMDFSSGDSGANSGFFSGMFENDEEKDADKEDTNGEGLQGIAEYSEENLPYTIEEKTYSLEEKGIKFKVAYPQLISKDEISYDNVNRELENCAMSTVDALYKNASKELKEAFEKRMNSVLESTVTYKISYAGKDKISVVFNDEYHAGNDRITYIDLRARTINLENGKVYECKDIVNSSREFVLDLKTKAKKVNADSFIASELDLTTLKRIFNEKVVDGSYYNVFYLTENGADIGLTYHYTNTEEGTILNGWETVQFTKDELQKYTIEEK